MSKTRFVIAINCMDGRVQLPVIEWMKKTYHADYVDMVTEPGPIKHLAENNPDYVSSIKHRVEISVHKHGSNVVAVVGHYDCAGNPVEKEVQLEQLDRSIELLKTWGLDATFLQLWVDEHWNVVQIK